MQGGVDGEIRVRESDLRVDGGKKQTEREEGRRAR